MYYFDYPKVKHSLAQTALKDPYPAWYMDTRGVIRGANLMAFWLWNVLLLTEPIRPEALLGRSVFSIFANNFQRIPIEQNTEFYAKKTSMVKFPTFFSETPNNSKAFWFAATKRRLLFVTTIASRELANKSRNSFSLVCSS